MLGSEYHTYVVWVGTGIVAIPLFKVDVSLSSECVWFGSEFSGPETHNEIESGRIFRPTCLSTCKEFGH